MSDCTHALPTNVERSLSVSMSRPVLLSSSMMLKNPAGFVMLGPLAMALLYR